LNKSETLFGYSDGTREKSFAAPKKYPLI